MAYSTRKIKCIGECIKPGDKYLHPVTLQINKNEFKDKNICPSEITIVNSKIYTSKTYDKSDKLSSIELQKFMALPYLNLNMDTMLSIYKIETIDSLILWVDINIKENKPFRYVNRIINIWNKANFDSLIDNNKILVVVYEKINKHYWNLVTDDMEKYIQKWFKTKKYDDFIFDLGLDLVNYLNKNSKLR